MKAHVLLCLLWSLVEVHSQTPTAPYLTFNNSVIPNNAYVDLSLMMYPGTPDSAADISSTVICHTDLTTCCGGPFSDGDWFFPNGTGLPRSYYNNIAQNFIAARRWVQKVRLQRGPLNGGAGYIPSGIYQCSIPTASSGNDEESLYVGIYGSGGTCIYMFICLYSK